MISFSGSFRPKNGFAEEYLVGAMWPLISAVVDTSSGMNFEEPYAEIDTYSALFSQIVEIIPLGSMIASTDGERYDWSPGGDNLMVSAPGNALCVGPGSVDRKLVIQESSLDRHSRRTGGIFSFPPRFG